MRCPESSWVSASLPGKSAAPWSDPGAFLERVNANSRYIWILIHSTPPAQQLRQVLLQNSAVVKIFWFRLYGISIRSRKSSKNTARDQSAILYSNSVWCVKALLFVVWEEKGKQTGEGTSTASVASLPLSPPLSLFSSRAAWLPYTQTRARTLCVFLQGGGFNLAVGQTATVWPRKRTYSHCRFQSPATCHSEGNKYTLQNVDFAPYY